MTGRGGRKNLKNRFECHGGGTDRLCVNSEMGRAIRVCLTAACLLVCVLAGCEGPVADVVQSRALPAGEPVEISLATFNIHDGRGRDGRFDLDRVAAVLPDVDFVGLQEASRANLRSGFADEPKELAQRWGHTACGLFTWEERPIWDGGGLFGNGFTTSLPVVSRGEAELPEVEGKGTRGVGWVETLIGDRSVFFFVTHLTLPKDATTDALQPQVEAVLKQIDAVCGMDHPCVLMGDFNAYPAGPVIQGLLRRFDEVLMNRDNAANKPRRDYIFITQDFDVVIAELIENDASDHPAVWCRLRLE